MSTYYTFRIVARQIYNKKKQWVLAIAFKGIVVSIFIVMTLL
jgi:hypothetical protein